MAIKEQHFHGYIDKCPKMETRCGFKSTQAHNFTNMANSFAKALRWPAVVSVGCYSSAVHGGQRSSNLSAP